MALVKMPKDLSKVQDRGIGNLTKNQSKALFKGFAVALPTYFAVTFVFGGSFQIAAISAFLVALVVFAILMYEKDGKPLVKFVSDWLNVMYLRPKQRPYKAENIYTLLIRQAELDDEIAEIENEQ